MRSIILLSLTMSQVSRASEKLEHALDEFKIEVQNKICADFGSSTGGFVDVLLERGAVKVYAVDTGYGVLDWNLRNSPKVIVMERTNAMHVNLPEKVDLITIDVAWTKQEKILPNAFANLTRGGVVISLLKPHYEAEKHELVRGTLDNKSALKVKERVLMGLKDLGVQVVAVTESPILGKRGGNKEFLLYIRK